MNYLFIQDFLVSYSLPTLTIAFIICIVRLILNKFFSKLPRLIKSYIPFILAMALYFAYDIYFVTKQVVFTKQSFYGGLLCGSLSAIFYSTINKIGKGKTIGTSATILLIEGILDGYVAQELLTKTATQIEKILSTKDSALLEQQVVDTLSYNCSGLSNADVIHLARLILNTAKTIKKT